MKKIVSLALAVALCVCLTFAVSAAPVLSATGNVTVASATIGGVDVKTNIVVCAVNASNSSLSAEEKEAADKLAGVPSDPASIVGVYANGLVIATIFDLHVTGSVQPTVANPLDVTLSIAGIKAGDKIVVSHYVGGVWQEVVGVAIADAKISFKLTSTSPFAVLVEPTSKVFDPKSPQTGDYSKSVIVVAGVVLASAAAFFAYKKIAKA